MLDYNLLSREIKMKSLFLTLLFALLLVPSTVLAQDISVNDLSGFDDLTDVQKAEVAMQIAKTVETNAIDVVSITEKVGSVEAADVDEWVELGGKVGKMLGGTAKELGIAANEFAASPLGFVTMGLVVWNYAGEQLYEFIIGSLWFLFLIPIWVLLFFKVAHRTLKYEDVKKVKRDGTAYTVSKPIKGFVRDNEGDPAAAVVLAVVGVVILLIGAIIIA
jgi:hypothetical protein